MTSHSKSEQILDAAESMIRLGGFHAFSFRDIAKAVDLKSASVHYHFATKEDLGAAVMKRYAARSLEGLARLKQEHPKDWKKCVNGMAEQFIGALEQDGKLCLCGMLAAECRMLPTGVVVEVSSYVEEVISWLKSILLDGHWTEDRADAQDAANLVFSALEGSMMISVLTEKQVTLSEVRDLMMRALTNLNEPAEVPA